MDDAFCVRNGLPYLWKLPYEIDTRSTYAGFQNNSSRAPFLVTVFWRDILNPKPLNCKP